MQKKNKNNVATYLEHDNNFSKAIREKLRSSTMYGHPPTADAHSSSAYGRPPTMNKEALAYLYRNHCFSMLKAIQCVSFIIEKYARA